MTSTALFGLAALVATSTIVGYSLYMESKRTDKQPNRKRPVRHILFGSHIIQKYVMEKLRLGEQALALDNIEDAVEHLAIAIGLYRRPAHLLAVVKAVVSASTYNRLLGTLQDYGFIIRIVDEQGDSVEG